MWSGETACSQPPSFAEPVDVHHVGADALDRRAHAGEHAREVLHVRLGGGVADDRRAGRQRGRHQRVLGAHHGRLVHEEVARLQAAVGRGAGGCRGRARPARRARGRRRGADRAGGGRSRRRRAAAAAPSRSGRAAARRPARRRGSARPGRRRRRSCGSRRPAGAIVLPSRRSTFTPRFSSSASSASVSRIRGTLCSTTGSAVSRHAARSGRAAFLFPAGTTVPDSGTPPSMTNFSMRGSGARWRTDVGPPRKLG